MFKYQENGDIWIYDGQNKYLINLINKNKYESTLYNFKVNEKSDIYIENNKIYYNDEMLYDGNQERKLIGSHNLKNIMVVLLITKLLNLDIEKAKEIINNFEPLEHRLEKVGTYNDITYFDDAIATIPEATIIFGGMDRNIDYNNFIEFLKNSNVSNLIGLPDTGYKICNELKNTNKNIFTVETIDEAVEIADKVTKKNHVCILSPAASSYNRFKNFEEKGNYYKNVIRNKYK